MTVDVFCVGGTGETSYTDTRTAPIGMLERVTRHLPAGEFNPIWVPYRSTYGSGPGGYGGGVDETVEKLIGLTDRSPRRAVWLGFSQGSTIVHKAADRVNRAKSGQWLGDDRAASIVLDSVGLIADPLRHPGQFLGALQPEGYGIGGGDWIDTVHFDVFQVSARGDAISSLPAGNRLRRLADVSEFMSIDDVQSWARDLQRKANKQAFQRVTAPWDLAGWLQAAAFLRGFLHDGRHTCYARETMPGMRAGKPRGVYTYELAQAIQGRI